MIIIIGYLIYFYRLHYIIGDYKIMSIILGAAQYIFVAYLRYI